MNKTFILTIFNTDGTAEPQQEYKDYRSADSIAMIYQRMDKTAEISIDVFWEDETGKEYSANRYHWKK